jgi:periplasmic copper chaperone A
VSSIRSCLFIAGALYATPAFAHVDVVGPGIAGSRQIVKFTVGHGCAGADTVGVQIHLPSEITAVRALPSAFGGDPLVATSSAGVPTSVLWRKTSARAADDGFYELEMRITIPDRPFTAIYFKSTQTCRDAMGMETTVEWEALPGEQGEPAAELYILPQRYPGWNKLTVPAELDDLSIFDDAQIVWAGEAAYSKNPATMELIAAEPGVTVLSMIPAGTQIWVKY